jgi:hypothetical protein
LPPSSLPHPLSPHPHLTPPTPHPNPQPPAPSPLAPTPHPRPTPAPPLAQSVHQQGFYHGGVLLSHVLLRWPERGPCAVLDRLYNCRQVAARTAPSAARPAGHGGGSTVGAALAAAAAAASINDTGGAPNAPPPPPPPATHLAAAAAAFAALPTAAAATTAAMLGLAHAPPQPAPQLATAAGVALLAAGEGEAGGGRTFADLLQWAWTAYERLGTLSTGHHIELPEHEVSQGGLLPDFYLAADVSDLGRLLLRMLLQPYRQRAAGANAPHHANPGPAVLDAPPNVDFFPPALQSLLLSMLHSATRQRPTMEQARSPTPITPPPSTPHPSTMSTHHPSTTSTHQPSSTSTHQPSSTSTHPPTRPRPPPARRSSPPSGCASRRPGCRAASARAGS